MEKTLRVLNRMVKDGVLEQYAIGDAVAAIFYIEPINTNKDHARIAQFMEHEVVDQKRLAGILERHGLIKKWETLNRQKLK